MGKVAKILGCVLFFVFFLGINSVSANGAGTAPGIIPEIDPGQIPALITLVGGGLFILRSKFRK